MNKEQIMESISNIELSKLKPFEDHPFSIRDVAMRSRRFICVKGVRGCFPDKVFDSFHAQRESSENASRTLDAQLATDVSP